MTLIRNFEIGFLKECVFLSDYNYMRLALLCYISLLVPFKNVSFFLPLLRYAFCNLLIVWHCPLAAEAHSLWGTGRATARAPRRLTHVRREAQGADT